MHRTKVKVAEDALDANTTIAEANRHDFDHAGVRVVNLMSAPGAGKTTLLEAVIPALAARVGVLEGDVQGSMDADRIAHLHVPVVQLNTDAGVRGRVMALYLMVFMGGTPFGSPLIGWVGETFGARWALVLGGMVSIAGTLLCVALYLRFQRAKQSRIEPVAEVEPSLVS